ncbi:MAG: hypothetical protein ACFE9V_17325 [Candidatus Hodarchaeota archaeon]
MSETTLFYTLNFTPFGANPYYRRYITTSEYLSLFMINLPPLPIILPPY